MPLFRHHALLLAHEDLTDQPITGPAFQIRPSDADAQSDRDQHWHVLLDLLREGCDEVAVASVMTSFDGATWHKIASVETRRSDRVVDFVELGALAPYLRVQTAARGDGALPRHRLIARLASDGPFVLVPG